MPDAEALPQLARRGQQELVPGMAAGEDEMRGEGVFRRAQGPDMQIMHGGNAGAGRKIAPHRLRIDGEYAVAELHRDERQVEADADREGHAEAWGSVDMGAPVMVVIVVFTHVVVIERAVRAHWQHGGQPEAP